MPGEHGKPGFFSGQPGWTARLQLFVNEQEPDVNWFFVHDGKPEGAGYFVAYERESNRRVGFIGLAGFRSQIRADRRVDSRARRAGHGLFAMELGTDLDLFGVECGTSDSDRLGTCRRTWSMSHPATTFDWSTSPRAR